MRRDCAIVERAALINSPADLWEHCAHTYIHTDVTVVPAASAHHVPGSQWAGTRRQTSFWRAPTPGTVNSVHSESCKKLRPRAELHTARLTFLLRASPGVGWQPCPSMPCALRQWPELAIILYLGLARDLPKSSSCSQKENESKRHLCQCYVLLTAHKLEDSNLLQ